ncbi:MAG: abortive infection family protein [Sulfitobacter sp.]|nr:abortive infection family protein [Sulfitobacter sp.]
MASDPAQAIASASSTLESVCKAILSRLNQPIPQKQRMQTLITETLRVLDLAPEDAAEAEMKRILGAVGNIAAGVGTLRTKYGTAHGRTNEHAPLAPVHARFVVNAMAAAALFLLETAIDE